MKIGVYGDNSGLILLAIASMGHDVVVISDDDIKASDKTIRILGGNDVVLHPPIDFEYTACAVIPEIDNAFRGGSRGKGGKVKYRRS